MAVPTSYTEAALKTFMHGELGSVATALSWTTSGGSYDEAVNSVLLDWGTEDIADVSGTDDCRKLRLLSAVEVWRRAVKAFTLDIDFAADGSSFSQSQLLKNAKEALALAEEAAAPYMDEAEGDDTNIVCVTKINPIHDPYTYTDEDLRVL